MAASNLSRRDALSLFARTAAGAALFSGCASVNRDVASRPRPNIIYIMADDHAAHALSCYGSRINKTPNLDRIANEGMRFDNCFCTNAICGPSRATILTGKYSHANGFTRNGTTFDGSQQTFPKLLQRSGYQTAIIGKWHLNSDPAGFDYWCIFPSQGRYKDPEFIDMGKKTVVKGYVTDILADKAIDYLKKRDKARPFCLMFHQEAPHRPWTTDDKHRDLYQDQAIPTPPTFNDDWAGRAKPARDQDMTIAKTLNRSDVKQAPPAGLTPQELKEWKYQRFIKDYLRTIASIDANVGRLLDFLDREGLADNTIVIYTSDNGFFLGDHGWFDKRFMYEESLRVPFIVRYPGVIKPHSSDDHMIINADFAPTFLDYAGLPIPPDMQGRSLQPLFDRRTPSDWRKSVYYHYYEFPDPHHVHPHYGVRTDRYKLIHYYTLNEWELFDLKKDPRELKSVYADPAYAKIRADLEAELQRHRKELNDTTPQPAPVTNS